MKRTIMLAISVVLLLTAGILATVWFTFRIYVPENKCAVLTRVLGESLPEGETIARDPGQKGIQEQVLGPGRYFYNPIVWEHELQDLVEIPAGDPGTWEWIHSLDERQRDELRAGTFKFDGRFPQIGVVERLLGTDSPDEQTVVERDSGYKGVLREVLTPGTYRINPRIYRIKLHPAVVIPAGFVGVVTNQVGTEPTGMPGAALPDLRGSETESGVDDELVSMVRPLAKPDEKGILANVLQPGVYFINPWLQRVTPIEIGFNEYSQVRISEESNQRIAFPSDTGYTIKVGVTVVWGIDPKHAAEIINTYGNVDRVLDKVIGPQLRSICRNIGSNYAARDFIKGKKREIFQRALTEELQRVCGAKNIEVLLALVREIEVHAPAGGGEGGEVTEDLKRTIQQSFIANESRLTKQKQREAESKKAELEIVRKQVEIARETITAETRVIVADIGAGAEKQAAEIDAQADLEVAGIQEEVAKLDGRRIEILGAARTDVDKMKNQAEAQGYKLLVDAFGSPQAYNLYTFAENFQPESIRLFYAGEGTFWTDLTRFEEAGAAKLLQPKGTPD
ncbi:MAG: hypothetical protein GY842_09885 [bacterium]|nr:hypothetical protein [bacterium]